MTRKTLLPLLAVALGSATLVAAPAQARGGWNHQPVIIHDTGYGYGYNDAGYGNHRGYRNDQQYRGQNRYRGYRGGRCDNGTGGTIIGAIAGGLLGHEVSGRRGDRTMGVIIGAGVGAVAGRAIDRSSGGNRC